MTDQHRPGQRKQERKATFFMAGLLLVGAGIIGNEWAAAHLFGSTGRLAMETRVKLWTFDIGLILTGLVLINYRWTQKTIRRLRQARPILVDGVIGLTVTVILLLCLDWGVFYLLNYYRQKDIDVVWSEKLDQTDAYLGYNGKANAHISEIYKLNGREVFNVAYSTDRYHRRITPLVNPRRGPDFILFFGGSFTFGEGVNDHETLPYYISERAPGYRPYNYGYRGYGPNHMLAKLQHESLTAEVETEGGRGLLLYTFINGHIGRAAGSMFNMNWAYDAPYYVIEGHDELVRKGSFASGRPATTFLYRVLIHSEIVTYFNLDYPPINEEQIRLTARIIEESRDTFREKFGSDDFYVLIYPGESYGRPLIPYLEKAGINYLDYAELFDPTQTSFHLAGDLHPTARAYQIVAGQVVEDIGLAGSR